MKSSTHEKTSDSYDVNEEENKELPQELHEAIIVITIKFK